MIPSSETLRMSLDETCKRCEVKLASTCVWQSQRESRLVDSGVELLGPTCEPVRQCSQVPWEAGFSVRTFHRDVAAPSVDAWAENSAEDCDNSAGDNSAGLAQQHSPRAKLGHSSIGSNAKAHSNLPRRLPELQWTSLLLHIAAFIQSILRVGPTSDKIESVLSSLLFYATVRVFASADDGLTFGVFKLDAVHLDFFQLAGHKFNFL